MKEETTHGTCADAFEKHGVMPEIIVAISELGWELPTDIQDEAIPLILGGGDVMAAAETGSGKTGAFGLPVVQMCYETLAGKAQISLDSPALKQHQGDRINASDRDVRFAIDESGLTCQSRDEFAWCGARGTRAVVKGKHYYEAKVTDDGLCRVGWSTKAASFNLGTDQHGYGFGGTGKKSNRKQFDDYGEPFANGDVIGCYIDCDNGEISFSKNGKDLGVAFQIPRGQLGFGFYPAVVLKNAEMHFAFTSDSIAFPPKNGYAALGSAKSDEIQLDNVTVTSSKTRSPLAIIMEPTRELAVQVLEQFDQFVKYLPAPHLTCLLVTGGEKTDTMMRALKKGVDIIVGTPGRILDFVESGKIKTHEVRFFVLDEADRLLDTGNFTEIQKIYNSFPKADKPLQVLMFSATLHTKEITECAEVICKFPTWVDLKGKDSVPETVYHACIKIDPTKNLDWQNATFFPTDGVHERDRMNTKRMDDVTISQAIKILKIIELKKIIDVHKMSQCLIFVRTRLDADNLVKFFGSFSSGRMLENEYSAIAFHSGKGRDRSENLEKFKNGEVRFLICTDLAARGLDIQSLPYCINMTLPDQAENYVHRVGRVGRADKMGLAITLYSPFPEKVWYHTCKSRGNGCKNTNLVENNGCCIWYNEAQIFKEIEGRIQEEIPELDSNYHLTGITDASSGIVWGQRKKTRKEEEITAQRVQELKPAVEELAKLEKQVQQSFWNLKQKWK